MSLAVLHGEASASDGATFGCSIAEELGSLSVAELEELFDQPYPSGEERGWMMERVSVYAGHKVTRRLIELPGKGITDGGVWQEIRDEEGVFITQVIAPSVQGPELYRRLRQEMIAFFNVTYQNFS
jgi:hypothetical protein